MGYNLFSVGDPLGTGCEFSYCDEELGERSFCQCNADYTPSPPNNLLVYCEAVTQTKWLSEHVRRCSLGRDLRHILVTAAEELQMFCRRAGYWCTSSNFVGRVGQFTGRVIQLSS